MQRKAAEEDDDDNDKDEDDDVTAAMLRRSLYHRLTDSLIPGGLSGFLCGYNHF